MFKELVIRYLLEAIKKILSNDCEIDEEYAERLLHELAHLPVSKLEACWFLNIHRSKFDQLVRDGKLPQGRKRAGFKELSWYKDELEIYKNTLNNNK